MAAFTRRRFLTISAAASAATIAAGPLRAAPLYQWRGVALGADASITLAHPQAEAIIQRALQEVTRLEHIFSLHDPQSALVRLNTDAVLENPPFELLECLSLCRTVHTATGAMFDPTVQPLWALYAERHAAGRSPSGQSLAQTLTRTGWKRVSYDAAAIRLQPGMALSLNGVAQGFIADKVAGLLRSEGLRDILVNTGEFHAIGGHPQGGGWPVSLDDGREIHRDALSLHNAALASSSPHGITFDAAGQVSHILDPRSGLPAPARWRLITVTAPSAGLADALSTAFCLMERPQISATLARFPQAHLAHIG